MKNSIIEELSKFPATCIADALGGLTTMDYSIKPLSDQSVAGKAFTVQITKGQNKDFLRAIKEASPGDVLVVDAAGDTSRAIAGDFVLGMAKTLGIKGVVVDGVIRDIIGIQSLGFPVFTKGTTANAGLKSDSGKLNGSISCGGVAVNNGDIIIGDLDGVVVIPQEAAEGVLAKAKEKMEKDRVRDEKVSGNVDEIHKYIDSMLS